MNSRSFFLGLGFGFIFVSILFFGISFLNNDKTDNTTPMTDNEIIAHARNLGMIFIKELPAKNNNPTETNDEIIAQAHALGMIFPDEKPNYPSPDETPHEQPLQENTEDDATTTNTEQTYANFTIKRGFTARSISNLLYECGIVDSAQNFEQFLKDKKATTKLKTGSYSLPKNSKHEDILNALTTKPAN